MPHANPHFLPGHVWHITHRCPGKFVQNVPVVQPLRSVQHRISPFQLFQPFNRCAPSKPCGGSKFKVQEFKVLFRSIQRDKTGLTAHTKSVQMSVIPGGVRCFWFKVFCNCEPNIGNVKVRSRRVRRTKRKNATGESTGAVRTAAPDKNG
jgi:hypothetical protein